MDSNIVFFIVLLIILWLLSTLMHIKTSTNYEDFLVQNYHTKSNFKKRLVLIIEDVEDNIEDVLNLIRNLLKQSIKVQSIILITKNEQLKKVKLIHNTCILNKVGGLSIILKEGHNDTIFVFVFPQSFKAFNDPEFLKKFLETDEKVNGIVKAENHSIQVDIDKVYKS